MAPLESLGSILSRIGKGVTERSQTQPDTTIDDERYTSCEFCEGSGLLMSLPIKACPNCDVGMRSLLGAVGIAGHRRLTTLDQFDPSRQPDTESRKQMGIALAHVKNLATSGEGSVILSGPVGVGKTHLAVAAAIEGYRQLGGACYVTSAEFTRRMLDFSEERWVRDNYVSQIAKIRLLCFDDLGSGGGDKQIEYIRGQWEVLIDERYAADLPTLVTTNFNREEFRTNVGVRTFDRLMDGGEFCYMPGISIRQQGKRAK